MNQELDRLMNVDHMTKWTCQRQAEHTQDFEVYSQLLATIQGSLRSESVPGDGRWSARSRSRRVEKHARELTKASRRAAKAAEALRLSYASHVSEVRALPGRRQQAAARRAERNEAITAGLTKALHKADQAAQPVPPPSVPEPLEGAVPTPRMRVVPRTADEAFDHLPASLHDLRREA